MNHKGMDLTAKTHIKVNKVWFGKKKKKKRTELVWIKWSLKSKLRDLKKTMQDLPALSFAALDPPMREEGVDTAFKQRYTAGILALHSNMCCPWAELQADLSHSHNILCGYTAYIIASFIWGSKGLSAHWFNLKTSGVINKLFLQAVSLHNRY